METGETSHGINQITNYLFAVDACRSLDEKRCFRKIQLDLPSVKSDAYLVQLSEEDESVQMSACDLTSYRPVPVYMTARYITSRHPGCSGDQRGSVEVIVTLFAVKHA